MKTRVPKPAFDPASSVVLLGAMLMSTSAFAQSIEADEQALPTITVRDGATQSDYAPVTSTIGGNEPTAIRDIPQTVTVVNRAVMDAQGAATITDALRNVPGITIGGAEGGQIGNNINLRGFTARTDLYLDGVRDRGQYYRDTFYLDSVEVLKGPSSMLFGRGSTGGVINQVGKKPQLDPVGEITATAGTSGGLRTTFDVDRPISDTAAWRIAGMAQDQQSTRDVMQNKDFGIAPSLRLGIGEPTTITLSALIEHNNDMPDYGIPSVNGRPVDVEESNFYGLTDDRTSQDIANFNLDIRHRFNDSLTLRNVTHAAQYDIDARETALGTVVTAGGVALNRTVGNPTALPYSQLLVQLVSHDRDITDRSFDNQTDLIWKTSTGTIKHTLLTGVEIGYDSYQNQAHSRNNLPKVSLLDPAYVSGPANSVSTPGNLARSSANSAAVYVNDTADIDAHWKVVAGLRRDLFNGHITNSVSLPGSADNDSAFTSVRGGLIWQPTDRESYYLSYGTSFNPSLEALTLTNNTQNLQPEKSHSYELGGKWDFLNGNLSMNAAAFRIDKDNARTQDTVTGLYSLSGNVRVDGFEIGIAGRITPLWQIFGGYTYLDGAVLSAMDGTTGKTLGNTPQNTATLWTTYSFMPNWEIGGGVVAMSSRFAANTDVVTVPGYTRWDATVAYHQPSYDLRLNLLNLTDMHYFDSVQQSDGGRATPGIGRTLLATYTFRF